MHIRYTHTYILAKRLREQKRATLHYMVAYTIPFNHVRLYINI